MKRSSTTYIEHDKGDDVAAAIETTRSEAATRLGGAAKAINATALGVTWSREWDEPDAVEEPASATADVAASSEDRAGAGPKLRAVDPA